MVEMSLADKYLTFSEESKKLLHPETVELLIDTFNKVYLGICEFFNNGEIRDVVFDVDPNFNGVGGLIVEWNPHTRVITSNNTIKFSPDVQSLVDKGDIDWITHELIHVAQDYGLDYPGWANEGLADYGRAKFGLYNEKAGWRLYRAMSNDLSYENGYWITAAFFVWIEKSIYATLAKDLNDIIKSSNYTDEFFVEKTGKTVDELWQMYVDENVANFCIWIEEYLGESLPEDMKDNIKSGRFDEFNNYILEKTGKTSEELLILWHS